MAGVIEVLLTNVLVASALALGIGLLALRLRRPALLHSLWILVLLKLVTPPVVSVGVLPAKTTRFEAASAIEESIEDEEAVAAGAALGDSGAEAPGDRVPRSVETAPGSAAEPPALGLRAEVSAAPGAPASTLDYAFLVLGAWLAGSLLVFLVALVRAARFRRLLARGEPAPAIVQGRARRVAACLGLSRCPAVHLIPGRVSPLVWALPFTRPRLVVPSGMVEQLSRDELESLLAHELAHVKRRDHWVRWLELLVTGLFWWLPLVWLVRRNLRTVEEQCCDAWVVWSLPGRAEAYARALLHTVAFLADTRTAMPPVASGARHVRQLERRLTMIMERTPPRMLGTAARLAVAVAAVLMLSFLPTWAQESREDEHRAAKLKLHRIERAIVELRKAGLHREVEHLARLAERLRAHLDQIDAVNGKKIPHRALPPRPPRPPRSPLEAQKRRLAELHAHIDRLKQAGEHEKARAAYEELKARHRALKEAQAEFTVQHAAQTQAESARGAGAAERQRKILLLERHLAELKALREKAIQAERGPGPGEIEEKIDRATRELDRARRALETFEARVQHRTHRGLPGEDGRERAASALDERAVDEARARIEAEERDRKRAAIARLHALEDERAILQKRLQEARDSGRITEAEKLERNLEALTKKLVVAGPWFERRIRGPEGEPRKAGEARLEWRWLDREREAAHRLERMLKEHQQAIARQRQVIDVLEQTLAETTSRYDHLRREVRKLEHELQKLKSHKLHDELDWKKLKKQDKAEKKRRKV
jgi:beta-lactamase regulating signal transducer with metallopeptidase domain